MIQRPSRPFGITLLAVLEILIGIVGLLASLAIIGVSTLFSTLSRVGRLLGTFGSIIGLVVLFFSLIWLTTGAGFLHGRGWSWTLGMIFSVLSLFGAIGALIIGLITGGVGGLIFWGLMMYYLTRNHVKAFFGKSGLPLNLTYGLPYSMGPKLNQRQVTSDNTGYGQPSAVGTAPTLPSLPQGSSTSIPTTSPGSSSPASVNSSSRGNVPICPYCHSTLPMGTRKCLTCGAAL